MKTLYQYGIGGIVALLFISGAFYIGYDYGQASEKNKVLEAQVSALLSSNTQIVEVFDEYDDAIRQIKAHPMDNDPVHPAIAASIDFMRNKTSKPTK